MAKIGEPNEPCAFNDMGIRESTLTEIINIADLKTPAFDRLCAIVVTILRSEAEKELKRRTKK